MPKAVKVPPTWALDRLEVAPFQHTNAITSLNGKTPLVTRLQFWGLSRPCAPLSSSAPPEHQNQGNFHAHLCLESASLGFVMLDDIVNSREDLEKMQPIFFLQTHNIRVFCSSFLKSSSHFGKNLQNLATSYSINRLQCTGKFCSCGKAECRRAARRLLPSLGSLGPFLLPVPAGCSELSGAGAERSSGEQVSTLPRTGSLHNGPVSVSCPPRGTSRILQPLLILPSAIVRRPTPQEAPFGQSSVTTVLGQRCSWACLQPGYKLLPVF